MKPSCYAFAALSLIACPVIANVEKVIFTGPETVNIPQQHPTLAELNLHTLTPDASAVRTNLSRVFPGAEKSVEGYTSWLLLDHLAEGQRYEFKVCWAAIEPTSFTLDTFELNTVWSTPELIQSLNSYVASLPRGASSLPGLEDGSAERTASVLFLRIQAAADYFTDDRALMTNPPPVLVDLILDPYLLNAVPRSLLPTVAYLLIVGILTWFVAKRIAATLQNIASPAAESKVKKRQ